MTSSMRSGSTPVRSISVVRAKPRRSAGCQLASAPPRLPNVVRTTSTMTGSLMVLPPRLSCRPCQPRYRIPPASAAPDATASSRRAIRVSTAALAPARVTFVGDGAVIQHDGPVRQLQDPVDLLLDHHQRSAVAIDLLESLVHRVDDHRGQAQGQLVGHQDLGRHHEDLRQRQQALLPAGEGAPRLTTTLTENGKGRVGALEVLLELAPAGPLAEGQRQVLLHRQASRTPRDPRRHGPCRVGRSCRPAARSRRLQRT